MYECINQRNVEDLYNAVILQAVTDYRSCLIIVEKLERYFTHETDENPYPGKLRFWDVSAVRKYKRYKKEVESIEEFFETINGKHILMRVKNDIIKCDYDLKQLKDYYKLV